MNINKEVALQRLLRDAEQKHNALEQVKKTENPEYTVKPFNAIDVIYQSYSDLDLMQNGAEIILEELRSYTLAEMEEAWSQYFLYRTTERTAEKMPNYFRLMGKLTDITTPIGMKN